MKKMLIAILSILNLLTTFLPYGLLSTGENYFLWKWHKMDDLKLERIREISDSVNTWNTIIIYITAILLLISSVVYMVCDNKIIAKIVKLMAVASICANLFFCYHLYDAYIYKYMNIGVLFAISICISIIAFVSDFKKRSLLILSGAMILSFPSFVVMHKFDVESDIEAVPYSVQMYFFQFYKNIVIETDLWKKAIPSLVVIFITLIAVICVLYNFKFKNVVVLCMILGCIVAFIADNRFRLFYGSTKYITYTYPLTMILSFFYLIIDILDKNIGKIDKNSLYCAGRKNK